jgi:hypothetical protein
VVATHVDVSSDRAPFLRNTWNPFYVSGLIITSDAFSAEGIEHRVRNQGSGIRGWRTEDRDSSVGAAFQPRNYYFNDLNDLNDFYDLQ